MITVGFKSELAAEKIFRMITRMMADFGYVTIAELYTLTGVENNYADQDRGWTNFKGIGLKVISEDEVILELPAPKKLKF